MTQTGTPCIYYGGEIGLDGGADPLCRKCMIWDEKSQDREIFNYLKRLIALRKTYAALRSSELEWLKTNDTHSYVIYKKQFNNETIHVLLNNSNKAQLIDSSSLPSGIYTELLSETNITITSTVLMPAYTAWILKKD